MQAITSNFYISERNVRFYPQVSKSWDKLPGKKEWIATQYCLVCVLVVLKCVFCAESIYL